MRKFIDIVTEAAAPNSAEFKAWFGNSQMVDSAGNPVVLYHGTRANYDGLPKANDHGLGHELVFLSLDPACANDFAGITYEYDTVPEEEWTGGRVFPVYARIVNPFCYTNLTDAETVQQGGGDELSKAFYAFSPKAYAHYSEYGDYSYIENRRTVDWMKQQGFDGFSAWEAGSMTYACFSGDQIRSIFDFR